MREIDFDNMPSEYMEIYDAMIMPVDTNISISSVILSEVNAAKMVRFINEFQKREALAEYGLRAQNRILMYGASGTGKTYSSKALANQLELTMLYVDISKAFTEGNVSKNISDIFKLGNYLGNCLLFFDECDSIAWARDSKNAESGDVRRACNSIFQQLDQMKPETGNVFISATNMEHKLDPAYVRRFDVKMQFLKPDFNLKECIKKFMFPKFRLNDDVDDTVVEIVEKRARNYAKLSYYEIQNIVEEAMKKAVLNGTNVIKSSDVFSDLATAMNIRFKFDPVLGPETKIDKNYMRGSTGDWTNQIEMKQPV